MIGTLLAGRYEVASLIADGPVFSAYAARDASTGRELCVRLVKEPFRQEPAFAKALQDAVERYRNVNSPGLEPLWRAGEDGGVLYLAGELVKGPTLAERIRRLAPFSVPVCVATGISLLTALDPLHRAKLAHGDVSAQNVVVLANGDVRLQLAGVWEAYPASSSAGHAVLSGMAPYLAPEVSSGGYPTPSSDVYAVGVLLFELLTGRAPYMAETPFATALRHRDAPTPSVRSLNPSVPAVLDEIVRKAMSKEPAERYATAGEMMADLKMLQEALRFGKTLAWPLRGSAGTPQKVAEPGPVAPRMSALREEEPEEDVRRRRTERDVPVWMLVAIAAAGAVVLSLLAVWLLFNLNRPKTVRVPNIARLSLPEARNTLEKMNLELRVSSRQPNDKIEPDRILSVDPAPGQEIREGGRVYVVVSSGSRFVEVPDVRGETLDKARSTLEGLGLASDPQPQERPSDNVPLGNIVETVPAAGSRTERTTRVKLVISSGPSTDEDPRRDRAFVYSLRIRLTDLQDSARVRVELSDARETRTVYEETRGPGDLIEMDARAYGPKATFRVYYDDRLVKEFEQEAPR